MFWIKTYEAQCGSGNALGITLKEISIETKVQGSALDALMRDGGIEELEKNGVNVNFVNWNYD